MINLKFRKNINAVVKYLQRNYPETNLKTIELAILWCINNPSNIHIFDPFEQFVDFNFGKFYIKQRLNDNKIKVN